MSHFIYGLTIEESNKILEQLLQLILLNDTFDICCLKVAFNRSVELILMISNEFRLLERFAITLQLENGVTSIQQNLTIISDATEYLHYTNLARQSPGEIYIYCLEVALLPHLLSVSHLKYFQNINKEYQLKKI